MILVLLPYIFIACGEPPPPPQPPTLEPVTIHITSARAPALVAFRDGFDAAWQLAPTPTSAGVDIEVNGPYTVTVVCDDTDASLIWQVARTPDDDPDLVAPCDAPPARHEVTGHMMQAGIVSLGGVSDHSDTDDWDFHLSVPEGSYDLIATDPRGSEIDDRIAVRRQLAVTTDLVAQPIDLARDGTVLSGVVLAVANPAQGETLNAAVDLGAQTTSSPTPVYVGSVEAAKVVPNSALAAGDVQSVTLRATKGTESRALRRAFRVGGDAAFTLPEPIHGAAWSFDHGRLSVALPLLPELDELAVSSAGASADGAKTLTHELHISSAYFDATELARPILDTDIPGYKPEWKLDFTKPYSRALNAQHTADGELAVSSTMEDVDSSAGWR